MRGRTLAGAALLVPMLLAACSAAQQPVAVPSPSTGSPSPSAPPSPAPASPSPSPSRTFDRTATPATTSGTLSARALPRARVLGPGWSARVDPGSEEGGYVGNGTPAVARDPHDVVGAMLPLGCSSEDVYATRLPVPRHALEVDYVHRPGGAHGVGLALQFRDAATAQQFFAAYTAGLRACTPGPDGSTVVTVAPAPGAGAFASVQVDPVEGETWRELVVRDGAVVRTLAVEGRRTPLRPWGAVLADLPGR